MSLDFVRPLIYLITSGDCEAANYDLASKSILELVNEASDLGIDLIQIREKRLTARLLFDLTTRAVEITRASRTMLLLNDRLDIAIAAGADGVHLTSTSIKADAVRDHPPKELLIGVSCHSEDQIAKAKAGADFALFGPVFASPLKGDGVGLAALASAVHVADGLPVLAIGGIDEANYRSVLHAGAAGFAAIRGLNNVRSLQRISRELGR